MGAGKRQCCIGTVYTRWEIEHRVRIGSIEGIFVASKSTIRSRDIIVRAEEVNVSLFGDQATYKWTVPTTELVV